MITIGLLTYSRNEDVIDTINILARTESRSIELIVVDNNLDSQENIIKSRINIPNNWSLIYHFDGTNKGVGQGRNVIFDIASNDIIIFLDDDVIINSLREIIDNTIREFHFNRQLAIVAYKILDDKTGEISDFEFPHKNKKLKNLKYFYTYYFIGAGHAIRRSLVSKTGFYCKGLGLYGMEEVELSYKVINEGGLIKYSSDSIIRHKRSPSGRITNRDVIYNSFHNKTMIAARHLKTRYYITHFLAWSFKFLLSTGEIKTVINVLVKSLKQHYSNNKKFGSKFYDYCKKCNAWLWW